MVVEARSKETNQALSFKGATVLEWRAFKPEVSAEKRPASREQFQGSKFGLLTVANLARALCHTLHIQYCMAHITVQYIWIRAYTRTSLCSHNGTDLVR